MADVQPVEPEKTSPPQEAPEDGASSDSEPTDKRTNVMAEIESARRDMLVEDGVALPEEEGAVPEEPAAEKPPFEDEAKVTIKVDGEEREVSLEELKRGYQIESAARERLDIATETMKRAEDLERRLASGEVSEPEETPSPESEDGQDIDWKGLADTLQYGESDAAAEALKSAVENATQGAGNTATPEEIELRTLDRLEWQQTLAKFGEEYPDIIQDQTLAAIAGKFGNEIFQKVAADSQKTGQPRPPYWDIFRTAGDQTRKWLAWVSGSGDSVDGQNEETGGPQAPAVPETKTERKRASSKPPAPRSSGSAAPDQPQQEQSELSKRRDGIADIASARGQSI